MIILHGGTPSPFFRKVRVALEEKGLSYETRELVPIPKTDELLALHPLGKIPVATDGELTIPDSSVICAYLEKKHPAPALTPEDPAELANALFLEEYADTKLAECVGPVLFERFIKPNFFQQEPDTARVDEALGQTLPEALAYLEGRLEEGAACFGTRFGIAEIAVGAQLQSLQLAGADLPGGSPKLAAAAANWLGRPSFKSALG